MPASQQYPGLTSSFDLTDSSGYLWAITVTDDGHRQETRGSMGSSAAIYMNDSGNTTSWLIGINTLGQMNTTPVSFSAAYPSSIYLRSVDGVVWVFGVDSTGHFTMTPPTIVYQSPQVYYSTLYGAWERGSVTSEAAYTPKSNTMTLTVLAPSSVLYPGANIPLSATVVAGLWDAAQVSVYTVYWALDETPAQGIARGFITTFVGQITRVPDTVRSKIIFEVADILYRLNIEVPRPMIQSSCRHTLFDANCRLNRANFAFSTSLAVGSTPLVLNLANPLNTASFWNGVITFTQGQIQFTTGQNYGVRGYIKNQNSLTQLLLNAPLPFPVSTGDVLTIYPGCNLSVAMCQNGFNNLINGGFTPFVPSPEFSI